MSSKEPDRLATRSTNASKHPGQVLNNSKPRRSHAEVLEEKERKRAEAEEKEQRKKDGMAHAAALEKKAMEKSKGQQNQLGVSSSTTSNLKRAANPRPQPPAASKVNGSSTPSIGQTKTRRVKQIIYETESELSDAKNDEHEADGMQVLGNLKSPASGSEYEAKAEESDSADDIEDVELEDDAPDTTLPQKGKGGKQKKKGVDKRQEVRRLREEYNEVDKAENVPGLKRKSSTGPTSNTGSVKTKKNKAEPPSGVTRHWEDDPLLHPQPRTKRTQSSSSTSSLPATNNPSDVEMELADANTDSSAFREGGISSDNDSIELKTLVKKGSKGGTASFRSLPSVKVEDLAETPMLLKRPSRQGSRAPSKRPKLKDLPSEASKYFDTFSVKGYNAVGDLDAWSSLNDAQILALWNETAAEEASMSDLDHEWFPIVKRLLNRSLSSNWTHKFREAGVVAVTNEFQRRGLETVEQRTTFVNAMLGRLVLITLAAHLTLISSLDIEERSKRPRGALMMAIQAVHRALLYSVSGEMKEPSGRGGGFSQENWGDITVEQDHGAGKVKKVIKRGSIYKDRLDQRPEKHWAKILETASVYVGRKKGATRAIIAAADEPEVLDDPEEAAAYEQALYDPMFD